MAIAGSLAAIGLTTNTLHIVIAGMLVAPGFMPITRLSLGVIGKHNNWKYGSIDILTGYAALIAGAAATTLLLKALSFDPLAGSTGYYLPGEQLAEYWTTISTTSLLGSAAASMAGAILVATKKSVFTSGVMIGLALVPTATIIGMALVSGEPELAGKAFLRFGLDVLLIFIFSLIIFLWVQLYFHKRRIRM